MITDRRPRKGAVSFDHLEMGGVMFGRQDDPAQKAKMH